MEECEGQDYLGVEMLCVEPIIETNISCGRNRKYDILLRTAIRRDGGEMWWSHISSRSFKSIIIHVLTRE